MTKLHQRGPRAPRRCTRVIAAAFALAMSFVLVDRASATTYTWTGDANSGLWNAKSGIFTTNWAGNVIPISAATNEIVFSNSSSNFPAAQDIANPFLLNRLTFGGQQFTITGSPLQFSANGAVNPSIVQNTALLQTIDNNLVLAADTTLSGPFGNGGILFGRPITGAGSLSDTIPITLNGGSVSLSGAQSYSAPVTLGADTTLTSTGGRDISFSFQSSVGGAHALTINTAGITTFRPAGGTPSLASVTTDAPGSTILTTGVETSGGQTYNDPVTMGPGAEIIRSTGGGNITFGSTLDGSDPFEINTAGTTTFGGAVGGVHPFKSLVIDGTGPTVIAGGSITTVQDQAYVSALVLAADTTLTGGSVSLGDVNGGFALTLNTGGNGIAGSVGGTTPLASFTVNAPGRTTFFDGSSVSTTGSQTYNDQVTALGAANLNSSGGDIRLASALNGPFAVHTFAVRLTAPTGAVNLGGDVSASDPASSLTINCRSLNCGAITVGALSATFDAGTFTGPLHVTGGGGLLINGNTFSIPSITADTGPITLFSHIQGEVTGVIAGNDLTLDGGGVIILSGINTYTGATTVNHGAFRVSGSIASSSGLTLKTGSQFIADSAQALRQLSIATGALALVSGSALKVGDGTLATPLSIASGGANTGALDIQSHGLIVDYSVGITNTALADVRAAIVSGFHGGDWAGPGIRIPNSPGHGIGYAQASEVLGPNGGRFLGLTADASSIVLRNTLLGDLNLDGAVDFSDLAKFAQNYNTTVSATTGSWWNRGDFTYDGIVDFNDLAKLAQNYNTALPSDPIPGAGAAFESDLAKAFATVPEPGPSSVLAIAGAAMLGRRRRRRRRVR